MTMLVALFVFVYLVTDGPMPTTGDSMWAFVGAALFAIGYDLRVAAMPRRAAG